MRENEPRPKSESPSASLKAGTIVRFYRGGAPDHRGRLLDEILGWDDEALERVHDFIQWLFPLDEPSMFNPDAPLVDAADREAFRRDPELAANLRRSFDRMLAFYGFQARQSGAALRIERSPAWSGRAAVWLTPGNHNHLRLTRIMKSLMLLGQPELAQALYERLRDEAARAGSGLISQVTLRYWKDAVQ